MNEKNAASSPPPRPVGYARVSTSGQTLEAQLEQLTASGCAVIYRETASGAKSDRKQLRRIAPMLDDGMIPKLLGLPNVEGIVAMRTSSSTAHYEAVLHGVGIGAIPTYSIARGANLIPVDIGMQHSLDIWLTCNAHARDIPRVRMMMDWVRTIFDPVKYEWFRDEFVHPKHFKTSATVT